MNLDDFSTDSFLNRTRITFLGLPFWEFERQLESLCSIGLRVQVVTPVEIHLAIGGIPELTEPVFLE